MNTFLIKARVMKGTGLVNNIINNLPFEFHLPGYNYCGPGTKLEKRLLRGDKGINQLDDACMHHDIAYSNTDLTHRHKADMKLVNMANQRLKSKDASKGEKIASWVVGKVMKAKLKAGAGFKRRKFKTLVSKIHSEVKKNKPKGTKSTIKHAYAAAKKLLSKKCKIRLPRVIPLPKTGGILPLIPIFAGLSALGALAGGAAGIAKTVSNYKSAQQNLNELERHNKTMESIALGKGLYIKPYRKGGGLIIKQSKN